MVYPTMTMIFPLLFLTLFGLMRCHKTERGRQIWDAPRSR